MPGLREGVSNAESDFNERRGNEDRFVPACGGYAAAGSSDPHVPDVWLFGRGGGLRYRCRAKSHVEEASANGDRRGDARWTGIRVGEIRSRGEDRGMGRRRPGASGGFAAAC